MLVLSPATADAAIYTEQAKLCYGTEAPGCVWMNVDSTNQRVRGYANQVDAAGGNNYDVAVYNIILWIHTSPSWSHGSSVCDCDGWFATSDSGQTGLVACGYLMHVEAIRQWQGYSSGSQTMTTNTIGCGSYP
jgi:hypothetical protein